MKYSREKQIATIRQQLGSFIKSKCLYIIQLTSGKTKIQIKELIHENSINLK